MSATQGKPVKCTTVLQFALWELTAWKDSFALGASPCVPGRLAQVSTTVHLRIAHHVVRLFHQPVYVPSVCHDLSLVPFLVELRMSVLPTSLALKLKTCMSNI